MSENVNNPLKDKSYEYACLIVKTYQQLTQNKKEFILSRQFVRSGTSIGANIEEALGTQTPKDFRSKMAIAYKEARESKYWIRLLHDTNYLESEDSEKLLRLLEELLKMLRSIQVTMERSDET